ncbi:unnamed protein product, partial [Leptidea sinapis]
YRFLDRKFVGTTLKTVLTKKYWKTFLANQAFWIPGQLINFTFVPSHLRVVYVASASFLWINVLCFIKRQKVDKE